MKIAVTLFSIALLVGCGESVRADGGTGSDAGDGVDAGGDIDSGPDGGTDGGLDAGSPPTCGSGSGTCGDDAWCDLSSNECGIDTGVCRLRPTGCPRIVEPVCACNGAIYENECLANQAGFDVAAMGGCSPMPDQFDCGYRVCSAMTYCRVVIDDTGLPPSYECVAFPPTCDTGPRDCSCLAGQPCADICEADARGNLTVTCPGG